MGLIEFNQPYAPDLQGKPFGGLHTHDGILVATDTTERVLKTLVHEIGHEVSYRDSQRLGVVREGSVLKPIDVLYMHDPDERVHEMRRLYGRETELVRTEADAQAVVIAAQQLVRTVYRREIDLSDLNIAFNVPTTRMVSIAAEGQSAHGGYNVDANGKVTYTRSFAAIYREYSAMIFGASASVIYQNAHHAWDRSVEPFDPHTLRIPVNPKSSHDVARMAIIADLQCNTRWQLLRSTHQLSLLDQ